MLIIVIDLEVKTYNHSDKIIDGNSLVGFLKTSCKSMSRVKLPLQIFSSVLLSSFQKKIKI